MYLLDRSSGRLYSYAADGAWPQPVGVKTEAGISFVNRSKAFDFFTSLDEYLKTKHQRLRDIFNEFDKDHSGTLERTELARLLQVSVSLKKGKTICLALTLMMGRRGGG